MRPPAVPFCQFCCLLALMLLFTVPALAQPDSEDVAAATMHDAVRDLELGMPNECLAKLDALAAAHPGTSQERMAQVRRVEALCQLRRFDDALSVAAAVVASNANDLAAAWALVYTGKIHEDQGDRLRALESYRKVEKDYEHLSDWSPIIRARLNIGMVFSADIRRALMGDTSSPESIGLTADDRRTAAVAVGSVAQAAAFLGYTDQAAQDLATLEGRYPDQNRQVGLASCAVTCYWIDALAGRERPDQAELARVDALARRVRQLAPDAPFCVAKAECKLAHHYLYAARDPARAGELLEGLARDYPATTFDPEVTYRLACAKRQMGDAAGALALYTQVSNDYPRSGYAAPAEYAAAGCCLALSQAVNAETWLQELVSRTGDDGWRQMARIRLAHLRSEAGDYQSALLLLREARAVADQELSDALGSESPYAASSVPAKRARLADLDAQVEQMTAAAGQGS